MTAQHMRPHAPLLTVQAEDAHRFATRDTTTTADLILNVAVERAVERLRRGLPVEYVAARLERSVRSADRLLGGGPR